MRQVLDMWEQQMLEYEAALSVAGSDEQREAIPPPPADDLAAALWKTVRGQTGTREVLLPPEPVQLPTKPMSREEIREWRATHKPVAKTQQIKTYEYEEAWAAPAVVWFLTHPEAFAKLFASNPKVLSENAQALLNSIYRIHYNNPAVAQVCPILAESTTADAYKTVEKIYEHSTDPASRASAALSLSIMLANPTLASAEGGQARVRSKQVYYLKQALNLAPQDATYGAASLTEVAEKQAYILRNLTVGSIPPRFEVSAPDGARATFPVIGKANLIFFWSPGEDVGVSIMSKQAALQARYPELVICPIVPHGDEAEIRQFMQDNGIANYYTDDSKGSTGEAYCIHQLPHAILTNERANILYSGYPDMQLQAALDAYFNKQKQQARNSATPPAPVVRPAAPATPAPQPAADSGRDTAPALRPMPKF